MRAKLIDKEQYKEAGQKYLEEIENLRAYMDDEPENQFALMAKFRVNGRVPNPNELMDVPVDDSKSGNPAETSRPIPMREYSQ